MGSRDGSHDPKSSAFGGVYDPGHALNERYRIVALIGEGGMGEVYLAEDLTLGQEVAMKFLPERIAERPGALARFRQEVRIARQVTHPNVARVHDIGEVDGRQFLTMEYVDGDDLSQLLKRIGRLPREKAATVSQQMCAGLAAAHAQGVLHRDLKPANVLMDSEGRLKITDFGLASFSADRSGDGEIVGTPAFMSPEQITGQEVDERSEIYSLGLVLYELFTGRRAFEGRTLDDFRRMHAQETPSSPSSLLTDIDPAVERVIMRCLEKKPADRPGSVRAVALALPGGDPLAAAVAAGETPDVGLVAEAGEQGGLSVGAALGLLVAFLASLVAVLLLLDTVTLSARVPLDHSPDVLERDGRVVLEQMGYTTPPSDSLLQFKWDAEYLEWIEEHDDSVDRWDRLEALRPPALRAVYRESPSTLVPSEANAYRLDLLVDPVHSEPGMARLLLGLRGELLYASVVPPRRVPADAPSEPPSEPAAEYDWDLLFEASDLDRDAFEPVDPEWTPDVAHDLRRAWAGPLPGTAFQVRVEAASFDGRPVFWELVMPWTRETTPDEVLAIGMKIAIGFFLALLASLLLGVVVLARRNLRLKRGDRAGAFRLAVFLLAIGMASWLLEERHQAHFAELAYFFETMAWCVFFAMLGWLAYLAIEPFVRRLWPHLLVAWVRLLDGRLRDPLVGRELLVGALVGVLLTGLEHLLPVVWRASGVAPPLPPSGSTPGLLGGLVFVSGIPGVLRPALVTPFALVVLLVLLRLLVRRTWVSIALFLPIALFLLYGPDVAGIPFNAAATILWTVTLLRVGLLAMLAAGACSYWLGLPIRLDGTGWLSMPSLTVVLVVVTVAAWGCWTALAGRRILSEIDPD